MSSCYLPSEGGTAEMTSLSDVDAVYVCGDFLPEIF